MKPEPRHVLVGDYGKYYESANSARSFMRLMPQVQFSHLEWLSYAWPGGYELHYYTKDGGVLCHNCANEHVMRTVDPDDEQFYIVGGDVYWEGPATQCDHCGHDIESEYGDPDAEDQNA